MEYEELLIEAGNYGLIVKDKHLKSANGRIKGNRIAIRAGLTNAEKKCVLSEELGHYHTTAGNIIDQTIIINRKQEYRARLWSYDKLIGPQGIINSYKAGCDSLYNMADFLNVSEEFLSEALQCYKNKYGLYVKYQNYMICFEPLSVLEIISDSILE